MSEVLLGLLTGRGVLVPLGAFCLTGAAVFLIASRLARHADAIADATGLGRLWIGTLLLAASTSLPELATDVNAALLDKVDIGVGDLMGSTLANMLLLALLDLAYARRRILDQVSPSHALVGTIAVVLTSPSRSSVRLVSPNSSCCRRSWRYSPSRWECLASWLAAASDWGSCASRAY